jgi:hypothetical protein
MFDISDDFFEIFRLPDCVEWPQQGIVHTRTAVLIAGGCVLRSTYDKHVPDAMCSWCFANAHVCFA